MVLSLTGVLIVSYIQGMIVSTNTFHDYTQAYYIANAGLETTLAKQVAHGRWYEDHIMSGSNTVRSNLSCSPRCFFDSRLVSTANIVGRADATGSCTREQSLTLGRGESLIQLLFADGDGGETPFQTIDYRTTPFSNLIVHSYDIDNMFIALTQIDAQDNYKNSYGQPRSWGVIALFQQNGYNNRWSSLSSDKIILTITNISTQTGSVCLSNTTPLVRSLSAIDAVGQYRKTIVTLSASQYTTIPSEFGYTTIN